jgi:hypothetical protein
VKKLLLLALFFFFTGCVAPPAPYPYQPAYSFYLQSDVDAETRASVTEAVAEWSTATGVQLAVFDGPAPCMGDRGCYTIEMADEIVLKADAADIGLYTETNALGLTTANGIVILSGMNVLTNQAAVTHEMGHAIGLQHPCQDAPGLPTCKTYAVMNPMIGMGSFVVACDDIWQYDAERGLPPAACP